QVFLFFTDPATTELYTLSLHDALPIYLTFAVYDYFNNAAGVRASVTGVEARAGLVELCNDIAGRAGFERLHFQTGLIQDFELPRDRKSTRLNSSHRTISYAVFRLKKKK